ncbi:MAG: hypothetical protein LBB91_02285, partial [Clostridiales bacterium]|nr:hypothetical protein [Clostridiales bacterium]
DSGTIPDKAEILFYGAGTNIELEEGKGRYILTNTAVANPGNIEAFEALWEATANPAHKGYIEPNNSAFWRSELCDIPANCTLWALAEVKMGGSATSSIVHDTLVYNNLFERKRISFRLLEGLYTDPAGSHTEISPYTEIPGNYGIPRNLSGGVHTGLLVRYNSVNIGLNSYMNDYWTAKTKNGADAPVTVSLGPGFPAAYLDLSDDGEGLLYTLYINNTEQKKLGLWELVPMAYVDKAGKPIPDSGGEPAMIWVPMDILEDDKEYGDDEEPDPPKPDVTSSDFLLRGGHYIPLKHHPYTPVGYYVSQYSLDVRDEPPGDPAKLNPCGDFSKDFNPEITDINFTPPERFYIVFAEGVTEIREIHLDQDEPDGSIIYPDIKTVANIEFAKPPVRYTAPKVADYVPVGWEIRNLKDDYEGKFVYGSDPEHFPTMDQNGLIFADISAEMISVGFGPLKPEELEIHWLYAKDLNNNGIPDDQEVIVNAFWNGIHPGFDFAVPLNRTITATRFGYDFTLTNDGSKDGNPEHIIELDSGAAQSSWLFDPKFPDNEAKVTIKPPDSTMQTVIFWYSLTSEEDDGFITVTVAGKTADSGLYSYPKRIAKKDLPYTLIDGIDLFAIPGYVLSPGQNHQVTGEGTYTFIYVSTEGTVKITLQEEGSGDILGFFYEPAKVGEPFSYNAPDLSGYKLVSPGSIGIIDNVLPGGASEIVFKYAKITSPVTIVYKEDISGRVIRVVEVIPPVVGEGNIVLTPDLDAPEFYTAKQLSVTYDYDGDNPVEVEAFYSKDLVNIPIMAVDHFTDATDPPLGTQSPFLNQRKGEITTVTAPAIVGYTLVGSNTRQVIALGNPETFRYRSASDIVGVTVNVYAGSKTGPIIQSIVILADVGETITVDPTSIKLAGYMYNASHTDNRLSWRFGDPDSGDGTDIRVIMIDIRAALNVYTKLGTVAATLHQSELLVTPYTKTVYAPNINGWAVAGYQLGDGTPVTTGTVSQVTLTDITASITNVTFLYQEIAEKYVTVTIKGVTGSSDLFIYNRLFEISDLPYTLVDGVDIPITVGDLILDPGQDHEIPGPGTYTFTYSLSAEHNSSLSTLSVSEGVLSPVFAPGTLSYTVNVAGIEEITIAATAAGTVSGAGTFELEVGENLFDIVVTAPCGESEHKTTYTVKVILAEPEYHDSSLSSLSVSEGLLNPVFAPETLSYTVNVSGIDEITISATGAGAISGTGTFELELGENVFDIVVTALCGESEHTTTYTVKVVLSEPELEPLVIIGGNTLLTGWPVNGTTIDIPIKFSIEGDFDQVLSAGHSFKLTYDPTMLEFSGPVIYNDPDGAYFILINQNPLDPLGTLTVVCSANYPKSIDLTDSHQITIPFKAIGDPARNDTTNLVSSDPKVMREDPLDGNYLVDQKDVTVIFGGGSARIKGDINNDGVVTPEDAMLLLQWLVGLPTPGVIWDAETLWAANIKGYGDPDPSDAALILRIITGG